MRLRHSFGVALAFADATVSNFRITPEALVPTHPGLLVFGTSVTSHALRPERGLQGTEAYLSKPLKIQIVELARSLIADEEHWCPHHLGLDKNGVVVSPMSSMAVKRCALGAVLAAAYSLTNDLDAAHKVARQLLAPIGHPATLMSVNDIKGHSAVLALFDQLIAAS